MLLRIGEYIANDDITLYSSDYAILYPAEGVKHYFSIDLTIEAICDCSAKNICLSHYFKPL